MLQKRKGVEKRGKRMADIKKNPYQSWTVKILKGE